MKIRQPSQDIKDLQFYKFRAYGFLKNLRFFDPFLILFLREAGLSFLAIGMLVSIRELSTNLLEIPTGVMADAFGRRKAMLFGFSAYLVSFVLFYIGSSYWMFVMAMIAFAFGETFRSGTHKAMILEHLRICGCEDRNVFYYGKTRAASQFGSALASLIAAGLVLWTGSFRIIFLASIVPYVLNLLLLASYPSTLDGEHVVGAGLGWRNVGNQFAAALRRLVDLLRDSCVIRGLLSGASFDALFKSTKDYLQPIVQAQALVLPVLLSLHGEQRTAILIGVVYFFIYLATSFASSHAGAIQSRLKSLALCINLSLVLGILMLMAGGAATWLHWDGMAIVAFLGMHILQNIRRPMIVGYLADRMDHRSMASGLSVEVQVRTLIMAVMAPVLGWLADLVGVGAGILLVAFAVLLVSPFLITRDRLSQKRPSAPPL
ncbi:MFS transporter [Candidatus Bipolaricaulota bacterium]|nr:MFS transporter [Candidatus Bipolaricaulota bacterium]